MAKQKKLPGKRPPARQSADEGLLLRSAESIGRMIGTLQRRLDRASKRFAKDTERSQPNGDGAAAASTGDGSRTIPVRTKGNGRMRVAKAEGKARAAKSTAKRASGGTRKRTASRSVSRKASEKR